MALMVQDMKQDIASQCGVPAFEKKIGKPLDQYFKEDQVKQAFKSFREQADIEFRGKVEYLVNSIEKQAQSQAQVLAGRSETAEFKKESPETQKLIVERCQARWKTEVEEIRVKAAKDFSSRVEVSLLAKNLGQLEATRQCDEFFETSLQAYKSNVGRLLEGLK
jgi:hypothetical protein